MSPAPKRKRPSSTATTPNQEASDIHRVHHRQSTVASNDSRVGKQSETSVSKQTERDFKWTPARIKLLGTMSDQKLAAKLKIGTTTVYKKRRDEGIAPFRRSYKEDAHQWSRSDLKKLGRQSDQKVAEALGISVSTVATKRRQLKIPSVRQRKGQRLGREARQWKASELKLLGKHTDAWVAKKLKMGRRHVYAKRLELKIPSLTEQRASRMWTKQRLKLLGKVPDRQLADEIGVTVATVSNRRQSMGIESYRDQRRTKRKLATEPKLAVNAKPSVPPKSNKRKPSKTKPSSSKPANQPGNATKKKSATKAQPNRPRRGK